MVSPSMANTMIGELQVHRAEERAHREDASVQMPQMEPNNGLKAISGTAQPESTSPTIGPGSIEGSIELVISPPAEPNVVLRLLSWLRNRQ